MELYLIHQGVITSINYEYKGIKLVLEDNEVGKMSIKETHLDMRFGRGHNSYVFTMNLDKGIQIYSDYIELQIAQEMDSIQDYKSYLGRL